MSVNIDMRFFLLCTALILAATSLKAEVIMCYYSSWAYKRPGNGYFDIGHIEANQCTHLMYAFAILDNQTYKAIPGDPDFDLPTGLDGYNRFNALKLQNPNLKTLLSVGGWGDGSMKYSLMVSTMENRQAFIQSAMKLITDYGFDGLDMDWEYPGGRFGEEEGLPNDKENFALLLQELRAVCDERGLLLTAAVPVAQAVIDKGYDVDVLAQTLDLVGLMSYDYHGWWGGHGFTGHFSPLHAIPEEEAIDHPGHNLNVEFSVQYWLEKGLSPDQLLVGLPTYGRGFVLADSTINGLYAEAVDAAPPERYTNESGYWGYNELCERLYVDGEVDLWMVVRNEDVVGPYAYSGTLWHGFDDVDSIKAKSNYILQNQLAGAMVWSIDTDDFLGVCGFGSYPLLTAMNEVLN